MDENNNRFSFAGAWCDYNGDGWPDLYVANDFGRKNLYRNNNGHFRDVAEEAGADDVGPGMSAAWLDYDGDGRPDLLVSNMWSATGQRIVNDPAFGPAKLDPSLREVYKRHVKGNSLFHNQGDGTFVYTGDTEGIEMGHWSWSCDGSDFDNDGTPEIYIACGMLTNNSRTDLMSYFYRQVVAKSPAKATRSIAYENGWNAINQLVRGDYSWAGPEPNVFYARRGKRFYDFSGISGIDLAEDSRAFALFDLDGDGCLDLAVKSRMGPQLRVFRNTCGQARERMVFRLVGTKSNRDAVGARVEVDGQVKWVVAGSAYLSQHTKRLYFGLGGRKRAEKVRIVWPSGLVQELPPLDAGFLYEVTEGRKEFRSERLRQPAELPADVADSRGQSGTPVHHLAAGAGAAAGKAARSGAAGAARGRASAGIFGPGASGGPAQHSRGSGGGLRHLPPLPVRLPRGSGDAVLDAHRFGRAAFAESTRIRRQRPPPRPIGARWKRAVPDARALPFDGVFLGLPTRDYFKIGGAMLMAGYSRAGPPLSRRGAAPLSEQRPDAAGDRPHSSASESAGAGAGGARKRREAGTRSWPRHGTILAVSRPRPAIRARRLRLYERALAVDPDLAYALVNAGAMQEELKNPAEAEKLYRHALAADPQNGDAANKLGLLLAKAGQSDEARALFEKAIALRRDDASAINNLAVLYINTGKLNDAIAAFQYGIEVAPDEDILYLNLSRTWIRMGKAEKAREVMRELLARKPGNAVALRALKELEIQ